MKKISFFNDYEITTEMDTEKWIFSNTPSA
jgi:hypothetical protein